MKKIKAASLIAASVIAVSSFGTLTAGAVTFTENKTTGAKTWTFVVTDNAGDYPENVTTDDDGNKVFANNQTYYVSNGYSTTEPADMSNHLTLQVKNSDYTIESKNESSLLLKGGSRTTSSTLSWTVPEDGTVTLTSVNGLNLYVNDTKVLTIDYDEGNTQQSTYNVKKGDSIKIDTSNWGGNINKLEFTPAQTYTAMYSFTETANDLNGMTLVINSTKGTKSKTIDTANISGEGDVKLGVIINNIPRDVEITSVTIQ